MGNSDLDKIISRADHLRTYGSAAHIPELAGMVKELAEVVKSLQASALANAGESLPINRCLIKGGHYWTKGTSCECGFLTGLGEKTPTVEADCSTMAKVGERT